jgi:hypothetical protein
MSPHPGQRNSHPVSGTCRSEDVAPGNGTEMWIRTWQHRSSENWEGASYSLFAASFIEYHRLFRVSSVSNVWQGGKIRKCSPVLFQVASFPKPRRQSLFPGTRRTQRRTLFSVNSVVRNYLPLRVLRGYLSIAVPHFRNRKDAEVAPVST